MAGAGFLPAAIDEMPMHDVIALFAFWREQPPVNELLAAVHGLEPKRPPDADDPSGIGGLIARAPSG